MKKKSVFLKSLFVVILSLLFLGCEKGIDEMELVEEVTVDFEKLELVLPAEKFLSGTASTEEGTYNVISNLDGSASIHYYDYTTRQLIHLSNQLTPVHDETNTGWIKEIPGGATLFVADSKLYVLVFGRFPIPSYGIKGVGPKLYQMNLDGSDRKEMSFPENFIINTDSSIAFDGYNLYLSSYFFDLDLADYTKTVLWKIDTNTLGLEKIKEFDNLKTMYRIYGVYESGLIMQVAVTPDEFLDGTFQEKMENQLFTYRSLSLIDLSEKEIYSIKQGTMTSVIDDYGHLYYIKNGETILYSRNLISGEEIEIDDIKGKVPEHIVYDGFSLHGRIADHHIPVSFWNSADGRQWFTSFDLNSKIIKEIDLYFYEDEIKYPVLLFEENSEYFFVNNGTVSFTEKDTVNGNTFDSLRLERYFSLIRKDDFWNSKPNYINFEDHVYPDNSKRMQ